jgi:hypothetical protein
VSEKVLDVVTNDDKERVRSLVADRVRDRELPAENESDHDSVDDKVSVELEEELLVSVRVPPVVENVRVDVNEGDVDKIWVIFVSVTSKENEPERDNVITALSVLDTLKDTDAVWDLDKES